MQLAFDHVAVATDDLELGGAWVRDALGVDVPPGGRHPLMATHNRLMRLDEYSFFEIIARDPEARSERACWFGLDGPVGTPRIGTWLLRTENLDASLAALPTPIRSALGPPVSLTRGELAWRLTVPDDGALPFGGAFPTLIEWPMRPLPASRMPDLGCTLRRLTVRHPQADLIERTLAPWFADARVHFRIGDAVRMTATFATPDGLRELT